MQPDGPPPADRVKVTPQFLAEQEAKQAAYAERRRQAMMTWTRSVDSEETPELDAAQGDVPDANNPDAGTPHPGNTEAADSSMPASRRRGRQKIHDSRQLGFEL